MTTIRIGGVPEHFNAPWSIAVEESRFADASLHVTWTEHPGGTGEMLSALHNDQIDIAILLTEGAVADYARRGALAALGTWVETPLQWGIHTRPGSAVAKRADVVGQRIAISRRTSGSHLMALLLVDSVGANASDVSFVEVGTIEGARAAFARDEADVFMWERTMTKPLVDDGEFGIAGVFQAPWPAFTFACVAAKADWLAAELPKLLAVVTPICERFQSDQRRGVDELANRFDIPKADLASWLRATKWNASNTVDLDALRDAALALKRAGAIESVPNVAGMLRD